MTDQQRAIALLQVSVETCNASLVSLQDTQQPGHDQLNSPGTSTLRRDLLSLLSLIHASTTKLSLTLKPSAPTYSASLPLIKDISDQTSALLHCTNLFSVNAHGATLIHETVSLVKDVIESISALLSTFLAVESTDSRTSTGRAGDEYMIRTAAVHELIEKARSVNGLSADNITAVKKKLKEDTGPLDDGLRELGEMIEDEGPGSDDEMAHDEEDGWDELGLGSGGRKMDIHEQGRAKTIHQILRFTTLLHKRVIRDLLSSSHKSHLPENLDLDLLTVHSSSLLSASDELIAAHYPPQDLETISAELVSFQAVIDDFKRTLLKFFALDMSLESQLEGMRLGEPALTKQRDFKKWFETCFAQIDQLIRSSTSYVDGKSNAKAQ